MIAAGEGARTITLRPSHVAAATLVPPLGLHLAAVGSRYFWIGTVLTVLGFVPGALFALFILLRRSGTAVV